MGYIRHQALILQYDASHPPDTSIDDAMKALGERVIDGVSKHKASGHIGGPFLGVNRYIWWFIAPDGSKEGWAYSNAMAEVREEAERIFAGRGRVIRVECGGDDDNIRADEVAARGR